MHFIGKVEDAELPDVYRMADVFVMPSTGEGFGIVFLEAMSCGTPSLGGGWDGSADALRDGSMGTVAVFEQLDHELNNLLARRSSTSDDLSQRVQATYGKSLFGRQVTRLCSWFQASVH